MPSLPLLPLLALLALSSLFLLPSVKADGEDQGVGVVEEWSNGAGPGKRMLSSNVLLVAPHQQQLTKEERQARKILRKKKKRLRELREEIRRMGGMKAGNLARSRDDRWRRRMLARLDAITKRLDHLETLIVESSSASGAKSRSEVEKTRKLDRHFASISRSLNGEVGMACGSHRDCRPGRCCHSAQSSTSGGVSTCVRADFPAGSGCTDSCQCTLQLHCFASTDNTTQPACKRATSSDIVLGTYLNDPNAIF